MRVLIVEDEEVSLAKIVYDLESLGVDSIRKCSTGQEALDHLSFNKFDLILVDLKLPDIDGIKLIRSIRQTDFLTKIVIVSGTINREIFDRCAGLGIDDILCKPYSKDRLANHLT